MRRPGTRAAHAGADAGNAGARRAMRGLPRAIVPVEEISRVAPGLHEEWESPFLWPRIQANLAAEAGAPRRVAWWRWAVAACASGRGHRHGVHPWGAGKPGDRELLTESALGEVQQAESAYARSIERLSSLATQNLDRSSSPLAAAYREKLTLLDAAIAEAGNVEQQPLQHLPADRAGVAVPQEATDAPGMVAKCESRISIILLLGAARRRARNTDAIFRKRRRSPRGGRCAWSIHTAM